jgi:hypothetical protein
MDEATNETAGRWVTIEVGYVDPQRRSCALCGRPLARKIWRETVDGETLDFCEPGHVGLYRSYWLPLYGKHLEGSAAAG